MGYFENPSAPANLNLPKPVTIPTSEKAMDYRDSTTCRCGQTKMSGSRSCRPCWRAGRGAQRGRRLGQVSLGNLLGRADLKPGQSITVDGIRFTKIGPPS